MKCRYCPRTLRTAESKARGYGLVCGRKQGLIPPPTPRHARPTTPAKTVKAPKAVATPGVHPDQTTIPTQPELPNEGVTVPLNVKAVDADDKQSEGPHLDACPCPQPDDRYLLEIDAGSVFIKHAACGKPPSDDWMTESLQLDAIPVQIRPESNCSGWHYEHSCDCDFWAQTTIPGLPSQTSTTKEN